MRQDVVSIVPGTILNPKPFIDEAIADGFEPSNFKRHILTGEAIFIGDGSVFILTR